MSLLRIFVARSHVPGLDTGLQPVALYPEAGHEECIKACYCRPLMQHGLCNEDERHGNRYTPIHAATRLALFEPVREFQGRGVGHRDARRWFMANVVSDGR